MSSADHPFDLPFERSLKPPTASHQFVDEDGYLSIEALSMLTDLWTWVASGYVVIPCNVGGTTNGIELTPRFWAKGGGSGYADLMLFSFVASFTNSGATTVRVIGDTPLDVLPLYDGDSPAGGAVIEEGVPYILIYCDASGALPDRMVLK